MKINITKSIFLSFIFMFSTLLFSYAQNVGISDAGASFTPDPSSVLELKSSLRGLLIPRMTTAQRVTLGLVPAIAGLLVYDTDLTTFYYWDATATAQWRPLLASSRASSVAGSSAGWTTLGNAGTVAATNFLGTTDAIDLVFRTNNTEKMRILSAGNVGINNTTPLVALDIYDNTSGTTGNIKLQLARTGAGDVGMNFNQIGVKSYGIVLRDNTTGTGTPGRIAFVDSYNPGSAGTELFCIGPVPNGYVGIGNNAPAYPIDIENSSVTIGKFGTSLPLYINGNSPAIGFNSYYSAAWKFGKGSVSGTHYAANMAFSTTTGNITFQYSNATGLAAATATMVSSLDITRTGINVIQNSTTSSTGGWLQFNGSNILANPGTNNLYSGVGAGAQFSTGTDNVLIGYNAGNALLIASNNTFLGANSSQYRTTGTANTCIGNLAGMGVSGQTSAGSYNTFLGYQAGTLITTGGYNEIIGVAGRKISTGSQNVLVGHVAGDNLTTESNNTFIGHAAGNYCATGSNNVSVGANSFGSVGPGPITGTQNTVVGQQAGVGLTSGGQNVILGEGTGTVLSTGSNNTMIGFNANTSGSGFSNSTAIGNGAIAGATNAFVLGNTSAQVGIGTSQPQTALHISSAVSGTTLSLQSTVGGLGNKVNLDYQTYSGGAGTTLYPGARIQASDDNSFSANLLFYTKTPGANTNALVERMRILSTGNVGIGGCLAPAYPLHVVGDIASSATIRSTNAIVTGAISGCSDLRYKKDITQLPNALQNILKLNGVHFYWKTNEFKEKNFSLNRQIGFIAQEIEKIYPEVVLTDVDGYKAVDYSKITPILVEAMKEQQDLINAQKILLEEQQKLVNQLKAQADEKKSAIENLELRLQKIELKMTEEHSNTSSK
jgi:hypothetical protein